jgi:hypothetical protein
MALSLYCWQINMELKTVKFYFKSQLLTKQLIATIAKKQEKLVVR